MDNRAYFQNNGSKTKDEFDDFEYQELGKLIEIEEEKLTETIKNLTVAKQN